MDVTNKVIKYEINIYLDPKTTSIFLENNNSEAKLTESSYILIGDERHKFIFKNSCNFSFNLISSFSIFLNLYLKKLHES